MAKIGFFARLSNLVRGFLSTFIKGLEHRNPEYVYEAAIEQQKARYQELRSAAAGMLMLNKKLSADLEQKSKALREIATQIQLAVEGGDDDVALALLQQKDELEAEVERLKADYAKSSADFDRIKASLTAFQAEIEKLKREKETMLARKADADARRAVQDALKGLSLESDMRALDTVRENINRAIAEADMAHELESGELTARMEAVKQKAASVSARMQLEELKRQLAEKKQSAGEQQAEGGKTL